MITDEQKAFFKNNGYLKVPSAFSIEVMNKLIKKADQALADPKYQEDILFIDRQPQKLLYLFNKGTSFLKLLVSNPILEILKSLSENHTEIVPTWEDLIIKKPFSKTGFKPHQDLPLQSINSNVFTIAIYLTDSHKTPVSFIPGSHTLGPLTKNELQTVCTSRQGDFIEVPANQGDIVIHNSKAIHKSSDNHTKERKFTWYLEFRTKDQLQYDSLWDRNWIMKRRAIFVYAINQYRPDLLKTWCKDFFELSSYIRNLQLKVPHVTNKVDFDMTSPYYHF